jgi:cob(I)alamin adenosyltransferase
MKIYTKKGDDGTTGLIGGDRVPKHHIRVESYGSVDELNSHIGLLRSLPTPGTGLLDQVQDRLFTLGSALASAPGARMALPGLEESDLEALEASIDAMTAELPELKNFVLPGASTAGAQAHVARCVCRRAERLVVHLAEKEEIDPLIVKYLNRLSDYLFTLARHLDQASGAQEILWRPRT